MERSFWIEKWERRHIGFHQHEINTYLLRHHERLGVGPGDRIMLPLCGKSLDMLWLSRRGHPVVGVELSRIAAGEFFSENDLTFEEIPDRGFTRFRSTDERMHPIEILCGNYFDMTSADLGPVSAVYDRAALIALPLAMRPAYAAHTATFMRPETRLLLVSAEYPQTEMKGPPFSVEEDEVRFLYSRDFTVELLERADVHEWDRLARKRGLSQLHECVYLVTRTRTEQTT